MHAAGGHAHASAGERMEAHRTPGASSAAMVKMARSRMAVRMFLFASPKEHCNRLRADGKKPPGCVWAEEPKFEDQGLKIKASIVKCASTLSKLLGVGEITAYADIGYGQ
jgi:hypothetical protein